MKRIIFMFEKHCIESNINYMEIQQFVKATKDILKNYKTSESFRKDIDHELWLDGRKK